MAGGGRIDRAASMRSAADDAWITPDAKPRLLATADVPALDINVDTNGGVVTLFGTVPSEASKKLAAAEVKKINGVKSVDNQLPIVPGELAEALEQREDKLRSAIEQKSENRPELSDAKIYVEDS